MKKIILLLALIIMMPAGCEKEKDFVQTLPACSSDIIFTRSPVDAQDLIRFIPLGHYRPPPHVFPTSHHYIDVVRETESVPVYSPCDGWILSVTERQLPPPEDVEYSIRLWACREVMIMYGHIPRLDPSILSQLGKVSTTESYTTGGEHYQLNVYEPRIQVRAGDKIAELSGPPGIAGMDFGTEDKRVSLPLANPARWKEYTYAHAVSFLDYATQEIRDLYYETVQFRNDGYLQRRTPPLEGRVCWDVAGTAQGVWVAPGRELYPEDPHLALIRSNFKPEKHVISMGTSVPGIPSLAYEFYPMESGHHNRRFDQVTADGSIYSYSGFSNIWEEPITDFTFPSENVILIQLIDAQTLRVEQQTTSDGPPWAFKNNFRDFLR
jgi:hypothetical protein